MNCASCGKALPENSPYCTSCGARVDAENTPPPLPESSASPASAPVSQAAYTPPPAQPAAQGYATGYVPGLPSDQFNREPLTTGQFMIMFLLQMIPIVGIVMLFIWAFGDGNVNKRSYARAVLLYMAIATALMMLFFVLAVIVGAISGSR